MSELAFPGLLKVDLHVHTYFSGPAHHLKFMNCHDSYSQPLQVYATAKERGMDVVTITDHDSIDGCLDLMAARPDLPDFFISEEVSCDIPDMPGVYVHVNIFDVDESIHRDAQYLKKNLYELVAFLKKRGVVYSLNHMFHGYRSGSRPKEFVERMLELFDCFEGQNATMSHRHNEMICKLVEAARQKGQKKALVAGSDSHTLRRIASSYTGVPAATKAEFLQGLREGNTLVFGQTGAGQWTITGDIYGVVLRYYPNIIRFWSKEFSLPRRLRNIALSVLAVPFLPTPLIASFGHAQNEKSKLEEVAKALCSGMDDSGMEALEIE